MRNALRILGGEIEVAAVEERLLQEVVAKHSVEAVRCQTDTDEVVDHHEGLRVEPLSLLHEPHQQKNHEEVDQIADENRLGVHKRERFVIGLCEVTPCQNPYQEECW